MQSLTNEQILRLTETFKAIDTNADGLLDVTEIRHLLGCTFVLEDEEVQEISDIIMKTADRNDDGTIDLSEFIKSVAHNEGVLPAEVLVLSDEAKRIHDLLSPEQIDMLKNAFIALDENGDGFICKDELRKSLGAEFAKRFSGMSSATMDELTEIALKNADTDKDGKISLQEFIISFIDEKNPFSPDALKETASLFKRTLQDWEVEALKKTFVELDTNQDGFLDFDELKPTLDKCLVPRFPDMNEHDRIEMIHSIIRTVDKDGDGKLSVAEVIRSFAEEQGVLPPDFITRNAPEGCHQLSQEQLERCIQAFTALDVDKKGFVAVNDIRAELHNVLCAARESNGGRNPKQHLGTFELSDVERAKANDQVVDMALQHILDTAGCVWGGVNFSVSRADEDGNGTLDLNEFIRAFEGTGGMGVLAQIGGVARDRAMAELQEEVEREQLTKIVRVFDYLDHSEKGFLAPKDLVGIMDTLLIDRVPELAQDEARRMKIINLIIDAADKNGDGMISLEEFITAYYESSGVLPLDFVNELAGSLEKRLTPAEVEYLKKAFKELDANSDGYIDKEELKGLVVGILQQYVQVDAHVERQEVQWLDDTVQLIMKATDENSDGKVSMSEFISSFSKMEGIGALITADMQVQEQVAEQQAYEEEMKQLHQLLAEEDMKAMAAVFDSLDKNGDKYLEKPELAKCMRKLLHQRVPELKKDPKKCEEVIDTILSTADEDGDGKLSLEEFIKSFYVSSGVLPIDWVLEQSANIQRRLTKEEVQELKRAFEKIDKEHKGYITAEDLDSVVGSTLLGDDDPSLRKDIMDAIILSADVDSNGTIDLTEFIRSFARQDGLSQVIIATNDAMEVEEEKRQYDEAMRELEELHAMEDCRKLARVFEHLDKDMSGYLERNELEGLMHKLLKQRVPDLEKDEEKRSKTIDIILQGADVDDDGKISLCFLSANLKVPSAG